MYSEGFAPGLSPEWVQAYAFGLMQSQDLPECSGPVVCHRDGAIECHGRCAEQDGPCSKYSYHAPETLWPCDAPGLPDLYGNCGRCR